MRRSLLLLVAVALLVPVLYSQDKPVNERYSAVAMGTGGVAGGRTKHFDFWVTRFTTDEEVNDLAALLKEKGQDALRSALEKLNAGRISPVGSTGNQIAIARKRQVGPDTIIVIITAREMPFLELYNSPRTRDYPFGFLQVKLNDKGPGEGQIMAAAKIRFDKKKGNYEIESFGNQYIKAVNIRPVK